MSENSYYKIEDAETLEKIDAFMDKRDAFYQQVTNLCAHYGFEMHQTHDSIQYGIRFFNMSAHPKDEIDKTKWKTSKHKSGYLAVLPRASAKEHKAEYDSMKPKPMTYDELNKIILSEDVLPWGSGYGLSWKKGEYFKFETSLKVAPVAIEILGSEYRKADIKEPIND
jgi:hypothetical protein